MAHTTDANLEAVIDRHFAEPTRTVRLDMGEVLMGQGVANRRLYRVRSGLVRGVMVEADGTRTDVMRAGPGNLVGVHSFFSGGPTRQTVKAVEPTELGYVERDMPIAPGEPSLERLLMPIVLGELYRRERAALELAERERETREQLDQVERVSALGQLAAGVAHELNNALTVLVRGTAWIAQTVQVVVDRNERVLHRAFDAGLVHGRHASAAEVRQHAAALEKNLGLSYADARQLARTGLSEGQLGSFNQLKKNAKHVARLWELGATIHDMRLAAEQAEHVVQSMRDLGAARSDREQPVDVNETIHTALKILRGQLDAVELRADLGELPPIRANPGKLVQVWTNLVKNGLEAMTAGGTPTRRPAIAVASRATASHLVVTIDDTGPGIPADVLPRIFEPSFSTKKHGLNFGLGLGLSIVQRVAAEAGGDVTAHNTATGARFVVRLPREVLDA
ncbi:MAG: ATP-binding protein [Planctomycetota bacterium]